MTDRSWQERAWDEYGRLPPYTLVDRAVTEDLLAQMRAPIADPAPRTRAWFFWKFVHNALIHPFLSLPWEPRWAERAHDWTATRCYGGG